MKKFKKRVGMTLIETTIVMIVATAALAAGASMYSDYLNGLTNRSAAHQMKEVTDAFSRYMDDNHLTLRALVPAPGSRTTVSFNDLKSGNYLPAEFENRTPFNHEYVLTIRRQGSGNVLQGLVHTRYTNSSFAIEPKHALEISRLVGANGGYTSDIDPQDVISSYGNYSLDLAIFDVNPGPGALVSAVAVDHATKPGEKYLHRNETGDPDHNQMNTHIDMNNNNLNNVDTVNSRVVNASDLVDTHRVRADIGDITTVNAVTGNIDTVNATTANATTGNITTVNSTTIHATHAHLTNINATKITSSQTSAGVLDASSASITDSLTANRIQLPGGPAPGSGELGASSVRTNNWFRSYGESGWYSETYGGGWHMVDGTWIRAYGGKSVHTPGTMQARHLVSEDRATVGEYLQLNGVATEGTNCSPNGLMGRASNGMMLSCQTGKWMGAGGKLLEREGLVCPAGMIGLAWYGRHRISLYSAQTTIGWTQAGPGTIMGHVACGDTCEASVEFWASGSPTHVKCG